MRKTLLILAMLAALPSLSRAEDAVFGPGPEERTARTGIHLYPFAEDYRWREIFGGVRLLEEEGTLYGAGAAATVESGAAVYRLRAEYFRGTVDADGLTTLATRWSTEMNLYGARVEADAGWRFPSGRASLTPYWGLGYRWWRRQYENSATVDGWLERWHEVRFKAGAVAEYDVGGGGGFVPYLEAAVRVGVFANNEIDFDGARVSMNPGGRVTPYAEAGLKVGPLKGAVYYERLEFAQSDPKAAPGVPAGFGVFQSEVKADIYGARVGLSF